MGKNILVIMAPGGEFSSYVKKGDIERPMRFISNYVNQYDTVYYASSDAYPFDERIKEETGAKNVVHIRNFSLSSKHPALRYLLYAFFLPLRMKRRAKDVSIIRCYDIYSGLPAIIAKRLMGKKMILSWQYRWSVFKQYNYRTRHRSRVKRALFDWLTSRIEGFVLRRSDYLFVTTDFLRRKAIQMGVKKERIFMLPNGVNFSHYPDVSQAEARALRRELGFSEDDKVFAFVGQIIERKGFPFLMDVFRQIKDEDIKLMVIGGGPLLEGMKKIASDNVKFAGPVRNKELYKYLGSSYAFVFPTDLEGHPNVILEAWKMGLPVITTPAEGMDLVEDGKTGLVMEKDVGDFVRSVRMLAHNNERYKAMKNNCLKEVLRYDWRLTSAYEREVLRKIGD